MSIRIPTFYPDRLGTNATRRERETENGKTVGVLSRTLYV
eukprot:COSAG04_NODE_23639_length_335_cov_0.652542_1_plen_39_part_10